MSQHKKRGGTWGVHYLPQPEGFLTYINKEITRNLLDLEVEVADKVQEQVGIFH